MRWSETRDRSSLQPEPRRCARVAPTQRLTGASAPHWRAIGAPNSKAAARIKQTGDLINCRNFNQCLRRRSWSEIIVSAGDKVSSTPPPKISDAELECAIMEFVSMLLTTSKHLGGAWMRGALEAASPGRATEPRHSAATDAARTLAEHKALLCGAPYC